MKKIILTMLIAFGLCSSINAQVQRVEWEILSLGAVFPTAGHSKIGGILATEVRLNLSDGKISPGIQVALSNFETKELYYYNSILTQEHHFSYIQTLCDYNFKPRNKIAPFVGLGISVVGIAHDGWAKDFWLSGSVRTGCEFYKFIRVSLEFIPMKHGLSYFSTRLGFVIGGRNK